MSDRSVFISGYYSQWLAPEPYGGGGASGNNRADRLSRRRPIHPGLILRRRLLTPAEITDEDFAEHLKLLPEQVAPILAGTAKIGETFLKALALSRFKDIALSVWRQQQVLEFFDKHGRRPVPSEMRDWTAPGYLSAR